MMALGSWLTLDTSISVFYSGCGSVQQWGSEWKKSRSSTIMTQCLRIHQKCLIWIVICSNLYTWFLAPKFKYIYVDNKHVLFKKETFWVIFQHCEWEIHITWYHLLHRNVDDGVGDGIRERWKNGCVSQQQYRSSSSIKLTSLLHLSLVISILNGKEGKKRRLQADFSFLS